MPPTGSLFVVFRTADTAPSGQRLVGWEDSDVGKHGLGLHRRNRAAACRRSSETTVRPATWSMRAPASGFEIVCVTWGPDGTTLHRNGVAAGSQKGIDAVSSDPGIVGAPLGGPGSGSSPRFRGDLAEVRVYNRQLDDAGRKQVEAELHRAWFETG